MNSLCRNKFPEAKYAKEECKQQSVFDSECSSTALKGAMLPTNVVIPHLGNHVYRRLRVYKADTCLLLNEIHPVSYTTVEHRANYSNTSKTVHYSFTT